MAKLPSNLVFLAITATVVLLFHQSLGKNQMRVWLLIVRSAYSVSIKEGGGVSTAPYNPSLYSLIRVRMFPPNDDDKGGSPRFTMEGVASGHRICMNKNGLITTQDMKLKKRRRKSSVYDIKRNGTLKNKINEESGQRPPDNCIFQSYMFNSSVIYKFGTAIYNKRGKNSTIGQFLAFNRKGNLRRYRRPLNNVTNHAIVVQFLEPKNMNDYINATSFNRCDGKPAGKMFNSKMKQCIRKRKKATMLSHIRHSNVLFRAIQKCQRDACKSSRRSNMTENSLQRKKKAKLN